MHPHQKKAMKPHRLVVPKEAPTVKVLMQLMLCKLSELGNAFLISLITIQIEILLENFQIFIAKTAINESSSQCDYFLRWRLFCFFYPIFCVFEESEIILPFYKMLPTF